MPVYERLGDLRSRAVTLGKIADVLAGRGELEEALCISARKCCLSTSGWATCGRCWWGVPTSRFASASRAGRARALHRRGVPGIQRLLGERDRIDAVPGASVQVLVHVGHVARDRDHRDVGLARREDALGVVLDQDAGLEAEPATSPRSRPPSRGCARARRRYRRLLEHHPSGDRVHRSDAVHDCLDPPHRSPSVVQPRAPWDGHRAQHNAVDSPRMKKEKRPRATGWARIGEQERLVGGGLSAAHIARPLRP